MHLYGLMCDMGALRAIAAHHGLKIVEDSAHCVEGRRDGVGPAELGDTACLSFYATKNLTCGEGGALVTDDSDLYHKLKLLHLHGMTKTAFDRAREGYVHWDMVVLGWKYNMSNIEAALLLPQFSSSKSKLIQRDELAARYDELLADVSGVTRPGRRDGTQHAWHVYAVRVAADKRDRLIEALKADEIGCVVDTRESVCFKYFRERYGYQPGDFPMAEQMAMELFRCHFIRECPCRRRLCCGQPGSGVATKLLDFTRPVRLILVMACRLG